MAFIQAPAFIGGHIVEIGKKKGTECPSISVVPERKPANTTDAQNSGSGFKRTPDLLTLALQDHESFMMEYRRTRKVIEEYYKNKRHTKFSEGVSTLKRKNCIETSVASYRPRVSIFRPL